MKKQMWLLIIVALAAGSMLEARGGRGGGRRGGRGWHRGGGHRHRHGGWRGHRRWRGGWGRPWGYWGGPWGYGHGWGPGFAVSVPIGGGTRTQLPTDLNGALYQHRRTGSGEGFCRWTQINYKPATSRRLCRQHEAAQSGAYTTTKPYRGSVSFGVGGGWGGPWYGGWGPYRRWGRRW